MSQNENQDPNEPNANPPSGSPDTGRPAGQDNPYARHAQAAADKAKAAAQDALAAAQRLFVNPVGGIGTAHGVLGDQRALGVAVVFALVAAIGLALSGGILVRSLVGFGGGFGLGGGFHFGVFFKTLLIHFITIAGAGVGAWLLAPVFGGRASLPSGLFIAATAWLPFGLAALLGSIIGAIFSNRFGFTLIMVLMLFGVCYLIQVLNAGLRHVAGIDERRAAMATPTVLVVAMLVYWLAAQVFG